MRKVLSVLFIAAVLAAKVHGHGFLAVPGARNSMWRLGYGTPENYDDNGLNCGGASNQWQTNDGKCGLCGDPYQQARPRSHEAGGTYAPVSRPVSRCYNKADNFMDIVVKITSHHKGYFEFRLCENNNMQADPEPECIDNGRLLTVAGTDKTRYDITNDVREYYEFQLDLPNDVTCTQCILHWKYNAGNSYGCDETGCDIGLGPQEQFINCADIAILPDCENGGTLPPTTEGTTGGTTDNPTAAPPTTPPSTPPPPTTTTATEIPTTSRFPQSTVEPDDDVTVCWAIGSWEGNQLMDDWCMSNCLHANPYCPESHCQCSD